MGCLLNRCGSLVYAISVLFAWPFGVVSSTIYSDPQSTQYGRFEVSYSPAQLLDRSTLDSVSKIITADEEITWKMYVPETYDPNHPAGLLVYVSPTPKGSIPRKWRPVVKEENLVWISANRSGNNIHTSRRMLYAVLGPRVAARKYQIDSDRIYLSGFSGGGKVASMVAIDFAALFKGAIYICGTVHWTNHPPKLFEQIKTNRYVFLSGDEDFNRALTHSIYRKYQEAGLRNIKLMIIPGMQHSTPDSRDFRKAINYLDQRN